MLRHSRGLPGLRAGLQRILACCGLALLFSASPSFAQSTAGLNKAAQATSTTQATPATPTTQQIQLEGELEVLHEDDFKHKKSRTRHFLKTDTGERYELKFKGHAPQHTSGTKVRVRGTKSGNMLALDSSGTTSYTVLAAPAMGVNTFGAQNTAVVLVNFQDQPANKPWTLSQVNSFVFGTVSDFYRENSYQQTWLTGQVYGWYTLPINSTDPCDTDAIATAANAAASAAGVNLSAFPRVVYMFPDNACSWGGTATVGGNPSRAFINGDLSLRVVGHEIGHTFGLYHSHANDCDVSPIGNTCSFYEYGDRMDLMGAETGHFNAYQKERLGWLNYSTSPPIITVQTSGSYVIAPIETTETSPKALKILKSTNAATGVKDYYYLEYRQPVGADYYFSTSSVYQPGNLFGGLMVHTGNDTWGNSSYMLDMTPGSRSGYLAADMDDPVLVVGQSYTDTAAGVTITPTSASSMGITVDVSFAKSSCTRANPSVLLSSSQSSSVLAGSAVTYTVAVTNNDSSGCGASTFNLQGTLPAGWTGVWGASSLSIGAGSATSTSLSVTSSTSATAGTYSIVGKATNSGATSYSSSGSGSYVIGTSSSTTTTTTKGKGRIR